MTDRGRQQLFHTIFLTLVSCILYVFMEWLFFVTKPSILSYYTTVEKISVLIVSPVIIFIPALLVLLPLWLLEQFIRKKTGRHIRLALIPAVFTVSSMIFLLIENFTNTVFGFYAGSFTGSVRILYLISFVAILTVCYKKMCGMASKADARPFSRFRAGVAAGFPAVAVIVALLTGSYGVPGNQGEQTAGRNLPDIIIFSTDGVKDNHMSAYGYERRTTPFIESLMDDSLVSVNHYSNAANTAGSVISLLTGKFPTTTGVIYPPDILTGKDAYEHLPGILKKIGYHNADISIRNYADTLDMNLQQGFDYANGRTGVEGIVGRLITPVNEVLPEQGVFLNRSLGRISDRLLHITGLRKIEDAYALVTAPEQFGSAIDDGRVKAVLDFIDDYEQPVFIHVHLMGTHGPKFRPEQHTFSGDEVQTGNYMTDFYDDAILDYDNYVKQVVSFLKERDRFDNSLFIINSDHSRNPNEGLPIPLIMKFPGNRYAGVMEENTQRIDIAPTILDYLGLPIPGWMEGDSLLHLPGGQRDIFITSTASPERVENEGFQVVNPVPPYYTLGKLFYLNCQRLYRLDLDSGAMLTSDVPDYTRPCDNAGLLSAFEVKKKILQHLERRKYGTDDLQDLLTGEIIDVDAVLSGGTPTYTESNLYIPALDYRGEKYAAILSRNKEGLFELVEVSVPRVDAVFARFDQATASLVLPEVQYNLDTVEITLDLVGNDPPTFKLTVSD